jgi:amino acid transporter
MSQGTEHTKLGEFSATAICGNDITSSCLYVSGLTIIQAGFWAPFALLLVAFILYLFRKIYHEVVGALPLNGGAYNALLNTTSKQLASLAACLTLLSYMATAVISAYAAMSYAAQMFESLPVKEATVFLLLGFAVLSIAGIGESAKVAMGIFVAHLASLTLLLLVGLIYLATSDVGSSVLVANWNFNWDDVLVPSREAGIAAKYVADEGQLAIIGGRSSGWAITAALFFGFSAAMLGISGFESSSNFVEEQEEGVFPKTLRNMWLAVSIFNPLMAFLALALVPIPDCTSEANGKALLAYMGATCGGSWLKYLISVDAVLVLSGAVLTSYIGVTGLVRRMSLDRCLPQFLLKTNRRGTNHLIIIAFFLLCVSVLYITKGNIKALAGVYTISFLLVMVLFAIGNILLKVRRSRLPRPAHASWVAVCISTIAVIMGIVGNIWIKPSYFTIFLAYFIPSALIVGIMLSRISLLKGLLFLVKTVSEQIGSIMGRTHNAIKGKIEEINALQVVFFTRGDNVSNLNNAILYVRQNEHTNRIKVVTVVKTKDDVAKNLAEELDFLDRAYPEIDVEFVVVEGTFGPPLIDELSRKWNIPANFMFIGSPGDRFHYGLAELGGVRLII